MANKQQITELLKRVPSEDEEAEDVIVKHFWEVARRVAHKNLSARLRRFRSGSEIANAALRSALSYLGKSKSAFKSRDEFEDLVLDIVRKKAKDAGRRGTAKKRDVRKQVDLPEGGVPHAGGDLADELAMAEELAERIEAFFMQEPDEERQLIVRLAIESHLRPIEILQVLASSELGVPGRSLRSVQAIVQEAMDRLADTLRDEYGELRPPKKSAVKARKKTSGTASRKNVGRAPSKKKPSPRSGNGRKKRND